MRRYPLLYIALALTALLWAVDFIALSFHLYWTVWWFDNISHFLGGFSLGFFLLYVFYESSVFGSRISFSKAIFLSFVFIMILGGVWEIFEYVNDIAYPVAGGYILDTSLDLIFDALGAISALLVARRFLRSS